MNRIFVIFFVFIFAIIGSNCLLAEDSDYKNNLLKVEVIQTGENTYDIGLYTQKTYNEPIKIIKKTDTSYYMLLPETSNAVTSVPAIGSVKNVNVKSYPYAGQDLNNGYTRVNVTTDRAVNLTTSLKTLDPTISPRLNPTRLAKLDRVFERYSERLAKSNISSPLNEFKSTTKVAIANTQNVAPKKIAAASTPINNTTQNKTVQTPKSNATQNSRGNVAQPVASKNTQISAKAASKPAQTQTKQAEKNSIAYNPNSTKSFEDYQNKSNIEQANSKQQTAQKPISTAAKPVQEIIKKVSNVTRKPVITVQKQPASSKPVTKNTKPITSSNKKLAEAKKAAPLASPEKVKIIETPKTAPAAQNKAQNKTEGKAKGVAQKSKTTAEKTAPKVAPKASLKDSLKNLPKASPKAEQKPVQKIEQKPLAQKTLAQKPEKEVEKKVEQKPEQKTITPKIADEKSAKKAIQKQAEKVSKKAKTAKKQQSANDDNSNSIKLLIIAFCVLLGTYFATKKFSAMRANSKPRTEDTAKDTEFELMRVRELIKNRKEELKNKPVIEEPETFGEVIANAMPETTGASYVMPEIKAAEPIIEETLQEQKIEPEIEQEEVQEVIVPKVEPETKVVEADNKEIEQKAPQEIQEKIQEKAQAYKIEEPEPEAVVSEPGKPEHGKLEPEKPAPEMPEPVPEISALKEPEPEIQKSAPEMSELSISAPVSKNSALIDPVTTEFAEISSADKETSPVNSAFTEFVPEETLSNETLSENTVPKEPVTTQNSPIKEQKPYIEPVKIIRDETPVYQKENEPEDDPLVQQLYTPIESEYTDNNTIAKYNTQSEDKDSATILASSKISETRGLYLAKFEGTTSLVGYIQDDIYVLYNFGDLELDNMESTLAQKNDVNNFYIVKAGGKQLVVKSSPYDMSLETVI